MDDDFDMSRRGFMEAGSVALAALQGGGLQVEQSGSLSNTDSKGFQAVAHLVGPADARPAPDSEYFESGDRRRVYYGYLYDETDGGKQWFITQDDDHWSKLPNTMDKYATPYDSLKTAQQYTQFALDPSKGLTRRRYSWFSNNALFDKTLFTDNDADGTIDVSTGSTSSNAARMHSAISGQYLSQSLAQPGVGLDIDDANLSIDSAGLASLSHGTIAVGVGWHDKSASGWGVGGPIQTFLGITYEADGAYANLISNGQHIADSPVPQSEWNLDTMDGTDDTGNPSGQTLRPQDGYVYQLPYTWYGHGALYVGVSHPATDEVIKFHKFNVPETSFDRPNMPPLVVVDDGGTAADLSAQLGGMQFALYGSQLGQEGTEERGAEIPRTEFTVDTASTDANGSVDPVAQPGDPVISFRREPGVRDLSLRLDSMFAELDNPIWVFMWDEYDDATALTGANFRNPNEAVYPNDETLLQVDTAATDYTPSVAVSRGIDYIYTGKNQNSLESLSTNDRIPIDATRVITAAHDGTASAVDPAVIRAVEGF